MPRKPPPPRMKPWKAASCSALSTSPLVERKTTAAYSASFSSVNCDASVERSTVRLLAAPISCNAV
jgi:hypothetical protein